jgi:asparagine N-glycosylation enzyme membrane subunit Stt3
LFPGARNSGADSYGQSPSGVFAALKLHPCILVRRQLPVPDGRKAMLWTIFVILMVLWLLGLVTSYTLGGFIHILLVIAIALALIQIISGRRAV